MRAVLLSVVTIEMQVSDSHHVIDNLGCIAQCSGLEANIAHAIEHVCDGDIASCKVIKVDTTDRDGILWCSLGRCEYGVYRITVDCMRLLVSVDI